MDPVVEKSGKDGGEPGSGCRERDRPGLAPYVPGYLVRRVAKRPTAPTTEILESSWGATLFVDLAGFTRITERFARAAAGAEQLSDVLNDYFGRMTTIIHAFGGDVALFAGDATLAVWPAESPQTLAAAAELATRCAWEIRQQLPHLEVAGYAVLRQRAVVGAGAVSFYEVGGLDRRWLSLLGGPALAGLAEALRDAKAGEVVLTGASWDLVGDRCRATPGRGGHMCLTALALPARDAGSVPPSPPLEAPDALLSPYVPEILAERLSAGHGDWLAEFRRVSVIFVGLGRLADAGGELPRIQRAVFAFQQALKQQGGTVYQVATDDKGAVLIGVFGLPPIAQENGAVRAVQAALAYKQTLLEAGIPASVGVATGRGFCGTCGSVSRRQYTVVGPAMNLAAHLMQAAAGSVLCDAETKEAARGRLSFDEGAPVSVKGTKAPQPVFRPTGRSAELPARRPLVGRASEEDLLRAKVRRLGEGLGGVVVFEGAPGIGKSSLLAVAAESVMRLPGVLLRGAAEAIEGSTPYFAWRETVRGLLRAAPDEEGKALVDRLTLRLDGPDDGRLLRWSALLNVVLPMGLADNELTANMESEARAGALQQIVVRLLEKEASNVPVALIFDDIQWMDSSSAALVRAVAEQLPQVLIVAATRPVDTAEGPPSEPLLRAPGAERLVLKPLSADAVRDLVCRCLDVTHVDDSVTQFIVERAAGHPLFSEELARAIRHSDLLEFASGIATLGDRDIRSVKFPDSIHAAIISRVDRLVPNEVLALKAASVIGESFSRDELVAAYPVEEDRPLLGMALKNLERLDLIRREPDRPEESYAFKHALVHESVYGLLPVSHRRKIHRSVAAFYEERAGVTRAEAYPVLARHWDEAGDADKAVHYLELAAAEAVRVFSSREAESFLRRADQLTGANPALGDRERVAMREKLRGEAAYQQANFDATRRHFARSLELRHVRIPRTKAALGADLLVQLARHLLRRATHAWPRSAPSHARREKLEHTALVFNRFSSLAWFRGDQLALVHSIFKIVNLADEAGDISNMVHALGAIALLCGLLGLHKAASFYSQRSLSMAEASKNPSDGARAHVNAAIYAVGGGMWSMAESHVRDALDLHLRLGDRLHFEGCLALEGYLHLARGDFEPAKKCFDEAYQSARYARIQSRIWARSGHLAIQIACGGLQLPMVEELAELALRMGDTAEAICAHGLIAQAHLRRGERPKAIAAAELGLHRLLERKPGAVYYAYWGMAALVETWLALCETNAGGVNAGSARHQAAEASRLLKTFSGMIVLARPRAALAEGRLALLAGRARSAKRSLLKGLQLAEELKMPFERALLHAAAARAFGAPGGEGAAHLAKAIGLLEGQGASAEVEAARGLVRPARAPLSTGRSS